MRRNPSKLRVGQPVTDEYGNVGVIEEVPTSRGGHYWVRMGRDIAFLTRAEIKSVRPAPKRPKAPLTPRDLDALRSVSMPTNDVELVHAYTRLVDMVRYAKAPISAQDAERILRHWEAHLRFVEGLARRPGNADALKSTRYGYRTVQRAVAKLRAWRAPRQNPLWPFSKPKPKPQDTMPGIWQHYPDLSGGKGKAKKNPSPRLYKVAMSNFTVRTVPEGPGEILESTGRNYRLRTSSRRKPSASPYLPAGRWCVVHGSPGASEIIVKRSQ